MKASFKNYVLFAKHASDEKTVYYGGYPKLMTLVMAFRELPSDMQSLELREVESYNVVYSWQSPEWE